VPSSAYLLDGLGGIFCTSATLPGQLITRLAVEPPTMLLCCILSFIELNLNVSTKNIVVQMFFTCILYGMREKEIEIYFDWAVQRIGGRTWKFTSPGRKGVADRIACLPDGQTWFVELKTKGGRLSELQKLFQTEMALLRQNYTCLWTKEQVDGFITTV
jgi:hypothetical protein